MAQLAILSGQSFHQQMQVRAIHAGRIAPPAAPARDSFDACRTRFRLAMDDVRTRALAMAAMPPAARAKAMPALRRAQAELLNAQQGLARHVGHPCVPRSCYPPSHPVRMTLNTQKAQ